MHTLTTVMDSSTPRMILYSRLSWVQEPKDYLGKEDEAFGVYLFGGIDDLTGKATNELFRLRPSIVEN